MGESIFSGMACFSPSVPPDIKILWSENGGTIARSAHEKRHSAYYFCDGPSDPWLPDLGIGGGRIAFHAEWVRTVVDRGYRVAMSKYVLDERYEALNKSDATFITPQRGASFPTSTSSSSHRSTSQLPQPGSPNLRASKRRLSLLASSTTSCSPSKRKSKLSGGRPVQQPSPVSSASPLRPPHDQRNSSIPIEAPTSSLRSKCPPKPRTRIVLLEKYGQRIPHIDFRKVSSGARSKLKLQDGNRSEHIEPLESTHHGLPKDFWNSISLEVGQSGFSHLADVSIAIPVNKVLESLSQHAKQEIGIFRPGIVYEGKEFSCVERDRRKTI